MKKVNEVLSGVIGAGSDSVYGLQFTIDDPTEAKDEARKLAFAAAEEKARKLAEAGGFELGELLSVQEGETGGGMIYPNAVYGERGMGGGGPGIEPGSQAVRVSITLRYEIED